MTTSTADSDDIPAGSTQTPPDIAVARAARDGLPELRPHLTVLTRRDGRLQLGWRPDMRYVLTPPSGVPAGVMATVLRLADGRRSVPELYWAAAELGVDAADLTTVLAELERCGLVGRARPRRHRDRTAMVVGRGPLSDAIASGLSPTGRVARRLVTLPGDRTHVDVVVVADFAICPPEIVRALMDDGIVHLPVRLRDGIGVVGPLVLPGHSSCLECVELTRCDYDREWPHLAAQLLGTAGSASAPTVAATVAFAVAQITEFLDAHTESPAPATIDHTIEVDTTLATTRRRRWPRHPLCSCRRR